TKQYEKEDITVRKRRQKQYKKEDLQSTQPSFTLVKKTQNKNSFLYWSAEGISDAQYCTTKVK
ncbi:MAG: hypothetical protein ACK559_17020, partial [bacterium]